MMGAYIFRPKLSLYHNIQNLLNILIFRSLLFGIDIFMASRPNFSELEQQTYIKFRTILEIPPKSIHEELVTICRDDALSYSTIRRWVNIFGESSVSVEDALHPEAPKLATNQDTLTEVNISIDSFYITSNDVMDECPDNKNSTISDLLEWAQHQHALHSSVKQKGKRSIHSGMISLIIPGVYLGNKAAASDIELLKKLSIVAILNIGGGKCSFPTEFEYHKIAIKDSEDVKFSPFFENVCNFSKFWKKRGAILFHCRGGMHRSPCFLAAHLMKNEGLSLKQSLQVISLGRPIAKPTPHMIAELEEFEKLINRIDSLKK